jgi:hypothetical protein
MAFKEPFRLEIPVLKAPDSLGGEDVAVFISRPVIDARPGVPPSLVEVLGMDRKGRHMNFNVPMGQWFEAQKRQKVFVEIASMQPHEAPSALFVRGESEAHQGWEGNKSKLVRPE